MPSTKASHAAAERVDGRQDRGGADSGHAAPARPSAAANEPHDCRQLRDPQHQRQHEVSEAADQARGAELSGEPDHRARRPRAPPCPPESAASAAPAATPRTATATTPRRTPADPHGREPPARTARSRSASSHDATEIPRARPSTPRRATDERREMATLSDGHRDERRRDRHPGVPAGEEGAGEDDDRGLGRERARKNTTSAAAVSSRPAASTLPVPEQQVDELVGGDAAEDAASGTMTKPSSRRDRSTSDGELVHRARRDRCESGGEGDDPERDADDPDRDLERS